MTLDDLRQDLGYAWRGIRRKPGFAAAVIITLGLGIGANAAMFGIVDRLLFRAPPLMKTPDLVHRPYTYQTNRGVERAGSDGRYVRFKELQRLTTSFDLIAGYTMRDMAVGTGENARERHIAATSANFFDFFDAPPEAGRYYTDAEDQPPSGTAVAVLGYAMWRTEYGGRRDILGSTVQIGPTTYTIIGVAPPKFVGLWPERVPAFFIPLTSYASGAVVGFIRDGSNWWQTYSLGWMSTLVRRKPNVAVETANSDLTQAYVQTYEAQRVEQSGITPTEIVKPRMVAGSLLSERGPNQSPVAKVATWVGGVSVIVLLIACANVANLLLARALHRRREIALRLALGVNRARLVFQLLVESIVLALGGGIAGIFIAHWGGAALRAFLLEKSEAAAGFRDPRTLLFAAVAAIAVGILSGLAPVLQASRAELTGDLKSGSREGTYSKSRLRTALLLFQGTLSVVLLVGAGLFVRSVGNVQNIPLGYDTDPILLVSLNMRGVSLDSAQNNELRRRLRDAAIGIPGVANASLQSAVPFWSSTSFGLRVEGIDSVSRLGQFDLNMVSPEHFATLGTRILRGRGIDATDVAGAPRAVVVSEAMGRVLWPGKDAIGQCIRLGSSDTLPCNYVVGVAENIKERSLSADSGFYYYLSAAQRDPSRGGVFVRTQGEARPYAETVRRRLQQEMPGASYVTVTPFEDIIGPQKRSWNLGATMFLAFGLLALALAAIGLYSVIAYNVAQRTHELGVRVALGAQSRDLTRLVVLDGVRIAAVGVVLGTVIALWAGRWVQGLLFNVSSKDPLIFGLVSITLIAVAITASMVPARRAARTDPNVVLRSE